MIDLIKNYMVPLNAFQMFDDTMEGALPAKSLPLGKHSDVDIRCLG